MTNEAKHTPEPWIIVPQSDGSAMIALEFETDKQMNPKGLRLIAHVLARGNTLEQDEANARRIMACVNAAEGISTEALEASKDFAAAGIATVKSVEAQRDELAEALREAIRRLEESLETPGDMEPDWSVSDRKFCNTSRALLKKENRATRAAR